MVNTKHHALMERLLNSDSKKSKLVGDKIAKKYAKMMRHDVECVNYFCEQSLRQFWCRSAGEIEEDWKKNRMEIELKKLA